MPDETYVLYEPFSSERQGNRLCFVQMTGIGPMFSEKPDEWARFPSKESAGRCPAAFHSLTFYEPRLLSEILEAKEATTDV